ncbi:hypothetical protein ABPG72_001143 [Tetrahymena utriculariae]
MNNTTFTIQFQGNLNQILGFKQNFYQNQNQYISENTPSINMPNNILIQVNELSNSQNVYVQNNDISSQFIMPFPINRGDTYLYTNINDINKVYMKNKQIKQNSISSIQNSQNTSLISKAEQLQLERDKLVIDDNQLQSEDEQLSSIEQIEFNSKVMSKVIKKQSEKQYQDNILQFLNNEQQEQQIQKEQSKQQNGIQEQLIKQEKPPTIPKTFNKYEEIGDIQNYKKYNMNDLDQQEEDVNKKGDNIFHQMLIDISDLTRSITNKGLQKLDKINNFSDTVIDEGT